MKPVTRFFNLLKQDRKDLVYLYVYAMFHGLINLSLPLGIQAIMGFVLAGRLSSSWLILTVIVMLGVALSGGFQILQMYIVEVLQRRLFARAAFDFAFRIPRFHISRLKQNYAPELVNRFFDTITIQKSMSKVLLDFSTSILQILFGLILLSLYHPVFIGFGITLILLLLIILYTTGRPGLETSLKESKHKYEMAYWLAEVARALPTFKLSSNSDLNLNTTNSIVRKYLVSRKMHFKVLMRQYGSVVVLKTLVTAALLIAGALLLIQNSITIGQFVASEIVIILILNSSEKFIMSMEAIYDMITSVEKLGNVTDIEVEKNTSEGIKLNHDEPLSIGLQDLVITGVYDGKPLHETPVNLNMPAFSRLCLSGETGSGKSSLLKILSTSLDNFNGTLAYNGIPIQNLHLDSLRSMIGCVSYDQQIFHGTYADNITLGRPGITNRDLIRITKAVGLDEMVRSFPNGYEQVLANPEQSFSSSQRIKLLVARALIGNPHLILLEDVFSSLDDETKKRLLDVIWEMAAEATVVTVSNNKEIQKKCDVVYTIQ
ncbi:MAG: ABC transporter ATP-binding protein [Bacteroidia bacterium]|nr:ABC transporter ATP-binding protein [Bacteroidia bacterium]